MLSKAPAATFFYLINQLKGKRSTQLDRLIAVVCGVSTAIHSSPTPTTTTAEWGSAVRRAEQSVEVKKKRRAAQARAKKRERERRCRIDIATSNEKGGFVRRGGQRAADRDRERERVGCSAVQRAETERSDRERERGEV